MLIVCPNCANSYEVVAEKLGAGRSVRCVRCRMVWFAAPPTEAPAWAEADSAPEMAVPAESPTMVAHPPAALEPDAEPVEGGKFGWTYTPEPGPESPAPAPETDTAEAQPDDTRTDDPPEQPAPVHGALVVQEEPPPPVAISEEPEPASILDQDMPPPQSEEPEPAGNVESLADRRAKRSAKRTWRRWRPGLPVAVVALTVVLAGLVGARQQVVQFAPQTASLYGAIGLAVNLRGLVFENVKTTREVADGVTVLVIEGSVVSVANKTVEVPRLHFGVRNAAGLEVYAWTTATARTILAPGETVEFRSRLASPPADARDVVIRFFNRRDVIAGIR
jgi:predicted Zn finger-like uncharacterized protein